MDSRRGFIAKVLAGLGVFSLEMKASGTTRDQPRLAEPQHIPGRTEYAWQSTVFLQVEDAELAALVAREARWLGADVYLGDPRAPDIYAIPYFIAIVGRKTLGLLGEDGDARKRWAAFMEHQAEVEDATPIVVVDGLGADGNWACGPSVEIVDWKGLRESDAAQFGGSEVDTAGVMIRRAMRVAHVRAVAWEPADLLDDELW